MGARGSSGGMVAGYCGNLKGGTALFMEMVNPLEAPLIIISVSSKYLVCVFRMLFILVIIRFY